MAGVFEGVVLGVFFTFSHSPQSSWCWLCDLSRDRLVFCNDMIIHSRCNHGNYHTSSTEENDWVSSPLSDFSWIWEESITREISSPKLFSKSITEYKVLSKLQHDTESIVTVYLSVNLFLARGGAGYVADLS